MPALECPLGPDSGSWKAQDVAMEYALILQENHMKLAHQAAVANVAPAQLKAEKLTRPNITDFHCFCYHCQYFGQFLLKEVSGSSLLGEMFLR